MPIAKRPGTQRPQTDEAAEAFIAKAGGTPKDKEKEPAKVPVALRIDRDILKRADAAARRLGITRSAYMHLALNKILEAKEDGE